MKATSTSRSLLVVILLAFAGLFSACQEETEITDDTAVLEDTMTTGMDTQSSMIDQIAQNPMQYVGQTTTISGDVEEAWGNTAFTISDGGQELLVIAPTDSATITGATDTANPFGMNSRVDVTGRVVELNVADLEQNYGIDIPADAESQLQQGGAAIVAETINVTEGDLGFDGGVGTPGVGTPGDGTGNATGTDNGLYE